MPNDYLPLTDAQEPIRPEDMRDIATALAKFDGKALTVLGQIEAEFGNDSEYLAALVSALPSTTPHVENGATWLLKDRLQRGAILSETRTDQLSAAAPALSDWQAQLHLAQMVRHLQPSKAAARLLAVEMIALLDHKRPFLRAWSLDALVALTEHLPELKTRAANAVEAAHNDSAASVRARARQLCADA